MPDHDEGVDFSDKYEVMKKADNTSSNSKDDDWKCGYFFCRPNWLQCCNRAKVLFLAISFFSAIQSFAVNGINNVNTTSYEVRFQLTSAEAGTVSSAYDFAAGILVLPISYFGGRAHKPLMLTVAVFILSLGSLTMMLPHFITGDYHFGQEEISHCDINGTNLNTDDKNGASLQKFLYVLIFGQVLHGIAGTILYTVGITCIDENVTTKTSPLYIGIMYTFAAIGPAIGYLLGGVLLTMYVDFDQVDVTGLPIDGDDPRWVGAWWVGFCISFILALICTVWLFPFPRELPTTRTIRAGEVTQVHQSGNEKITEQEGFGTTFKDIPKSFLILIKNPPFMFITCGMVTEGIITSGFATFLPKFLENQFNQTSSTAALTAGALIVLGVGGGQFFGGYIVKKAKLMVRGMLRLNALYCCIALACLGIFWAQCDPIRTAGINVKYTNTNESISPVNMDSQCNSQCNCGTSKYEPVCGANGVDYFTPCHAGCLTVIQDKDSKEKNFTNCACIPPVAGSAHAIQGNCDNECSLLYVSAVFLFLVIFFTFLAGVPATSSTLRCISHSQRTFGLGVQWVFIRFLGTVPGPIVFGAVIDSTCLLRQQWKDPVTDIVIRTGVCWVYDVEGMSRNLFLMGISMKVLSGTFFFLASYFYKAPPVGKVVNDSKDSGLEVDKDPDKEMVGYDNRAKEPDKEMAGYDNRAMEPDDHNDTTEL